jgi:organic hydroperoxide reductase OsmC/OhrA
MEPFPHFYTVAGSLDGDEVQLSSAGLPDISSAAPTEFDGPGTHWSPETLLTGAIADCFLLSFKVIAAASRFDYGSVTCAVTARLERIDRVTAFTAVVISPCLTIGDAELRERALRLLQKAEENCLITNSLKATVSFEPEVVVKE